MYETMCPVLTGVDRLFLCMLTLTSGSDPVSELDVSREGGGRGRYRLNIFSFFVPCFRASSFLCNGLGSSVPTPAFVRNQ